MKPDLHVQHITSCLPSERRETINIGKLSLNKTAGQTTRHTLGRSLPVCIDLGSNTLSEGDKKKLVWWLSFVKSDILTEDAVHHVRDENEDLCTGHAPVEVHGSSHLRHHLREDHSAFTKACQDARRF